MPTLINARSQAHSPGERIELFHLDATSVGHGHDYFVQSKKISGNISFGGQEYTPRDVKFDGFEVSAVGVLPRPTIEISNLSGFPQLLVNTYGDLLGCTIQRVRTFKQYLDGEAEEDPTAYFGPDTFRVEQKLSENKSIIKWQLSAVIDQEDAMIPRRQVIRDTCLWRYRTWLSGSSFDYSKAQCPYTGTDYFDINGAPTTAQYDRCARHVKACKLRFGEDQPLPFGGFPGVGRVGA